MEMRQGGMIPSARIHFVWQGVHTRGWFERRATEILPLPYSTSHISSIANTWVLTSSSCNSPPSRPPSLLHPPYIFAFALANWSRGYKYFIGEIIFWRGKARPLETRVHNLQGIYRDRDTPPCAPRRAPSPIRSTGWLVRINTGGAISGCVSTAHWWVWKRVDSWLWVEVERER